MAKNNQVYFFGGKRADGSAGMRGLLGGKGANLAEMVNVGIPVPPGFTISTEICNAYLSGDNTFPAGLTKAVDAALLQIGAERFKQGDYISLDGTTGWVMGGEVKTTPSEVIRVLLSSRKPRKLSPSYQAYSTIMKVADEYRQLKPPPPGLISSDVIAEGA